MAVPIVVDNRIRMPLSSLTEEVAAGLRSAFDHPNPAYAWKRQQKMPGWWAEPKSYRTWREYRRDGEEWIAIPRGGMGTVRRILAEGGLSWSVEDVRVRGVKVRLPKSNVDLYPHQEEIVRVAVEREQCIVRSATGSGKTSALIALASKLGVPTLIAVHTRALFDQWAERLEKELGMGPKDIGIIAGGKRRIAPITLAIHRSLHEAVKSQEVLKYFGAVFADEVHLVGADGVFASIDPFPARYRIGASADHRRKDRKECLIHDLFGDVALDVSKDDLIEQGVVLDVEVRVVPTRFRADWYGLEGEQEIDFVRLVNEMGKDPDRNKIIADIAVTERKRGEQVLALTHERAHCLEVARLIAGATNAQVGVMMGGEDMAAEFARARDGLRNGDVRVAVGTYKACGTGIDLPRVAVGIACTPVAANEQFFGQVRGRFCRSAEGKTSARLYYVLDETVFRSHLRNLERWNRTVMVRLGRSWVDARQYSARR